MENSAALLVAEKVNGYFVTEERKEAQKREKLQAQKEYILEKRARIGWMTLAVSLVCVFSIPMLYMNMKVNQQAQAVAQLESRVNETVRANDELEKRVRSTMDYSQLKEQAIALGMTYAPEDQVIYYEVPGDDYMLQLGDLDPAGK